jgi:hypothetical protein
MAMTEERFWPDWRQIARDLYDALGAIEDQTDGGSMYWPASVQPAIDAYEYATDATDLES